MSISETTAIELNKLKHFEQLGYPTYEAVLMVEDGFDWHEVENLLKNGCPHNLAQKICAPLNSIYRSI